VNDVVRLIASPTQATDQHDITEIIVNRHFIAHMFWRSDHTEVHFANGDRGIRMRESPAEILSMPSIMPRS
jgi:hypothetical protein